MWRLAYSNAMRHVATRRVGFVGAATAVAAGIGCHHSECLMIDIDEATANCLRAALSNAAIEPFTSLLTMAGAGIMTRGGVAADAMRVSLEPANDRRPHASDANLEAVWEAKLEAANASGGRLFDMSKFRLHRIGWSDANCEVLLIELGLTSYKEYVGTNQMPQAQRTSLEADGMADFGEPRAHLSNALGCEAVLVTSDGQVVLLRRSGKVLSGHGQYNGPSGHAEPLHAGIEAHAGSGEQRASLEGRARSELFEAILAEVHEETNVPRAALSTPVLIGAMEDDQRKPDLLFLVRTCLDAEGVRQAYAEGAAEGWESDRIAFWPVAELGGCEEAMRLSAVTRATHHALSLLRPTVGS